MNPKLKAALAFLGFDDAETVPKMKDIRKRYIILSFKLHPDKPGGSDAMFQALLDAYNLAGDAAEQSEVDNNDMDDIIARKMFCQFKFKSITENTDTFTIFIESIYAECWDDVLTEHCGMAIDKGPHGKKISFQDSCLEAMSTIFITKYRTNKLLIQSKKHSMNFHFIIIKKPH